MSSVEITNVTRYDVERGNTKEDAKCDDESSVLQDTVHTPQLVNLEFFMGLLSTTFLAISLL